MQIRDVLKLFTGKSGFDVVLEGAPCCVLVWNHHQMNNVVRSRFVFASQISAACS
jgi:hypothetical protein